MTVRLFVGLPLLVHLGYTALTSLPIGSIPGRPAGAQHRRNQDLRARVVGFLNEVRRVEEYAQRAKTAGWSAKEVQANMRAAQQRMMAAASHVAEATGRSTPEPAELDAGAGRGRVTILTHEKPRHLPT